MLNDSWWRIYLSCRVQQHSAEQVSSLRADHQRELESLLTGHALAHSSSKVAELTNQVTAQEVKAHNGPITCQLKVIGGVPGITYQLDKWVCFYEPSDHGSASA
jgi:hypothetical protein